MTTADFASLREQLNRRLADLRAEIHAGDLAAFEQSSAVPTRDVADRKDIADQHAATDVQGAEVQRDVDELVQVKAALHRLDAGNYGACTDCGEPIALARLRVQPAAARCAACQTAVESRRR